MPLRTDRLLIPALALLLLFLVLLGMAPLLAGRAEFIGDDYYFIVNNPLVTSGGIESLKGIWLKPMQLEYFPITITSYAVEHALWGSTVVPYRLTNLMIYWCIGLTGLSLALHFGRPRTDSPASTREYAAAFLAMLVMLLHPVNVESVAGISHRKELLYVLFGLLSFRYYAISPITARTTAAALGFMALAQLSKGSGIILPVMFLGYELFPHDEDRPLKKRLARLVPYGILSAAIFTVQFLVAYRSGVVATDPVGSLAVRIGGIVRAFNFMIMKFFWPVGLTYDYDITWPQGIPGAETVLPVIVLGLFAYLAWKRRFPQLMLGLLVLIPLLPYVQIVPLAHNLKGQMVFYDHYLLFSTVLFALPLTRILLSIPDRWHRPLLVLPLVIVVMWLSYDFHLSRFWQTRESLYQRLIATSPSLPKAYLFLGRSYLEAGRYEEAKATLKKVFATKQWDPTFAEVYQALGDACAFTGAYAEAETNYRAYLKYKPDDLKSLQNLSSSLIEMRKLADARTVLDTLLRYYPADSIGNNNLALVVAQQKGTP